MAKDCKESDTNKSQGNQSRNRFKGKCSICGVWGHRSYAFYEHARNANLRPEVWNSKSKIRK